jgi:hypothetical protein
VAAHNKEATMAVGFILQFGNMGQDKYDAVMKELGLSVNSNAGNWPDGVLTHTAGKTAAGWCVVDVWDSEAAFGKFRETRLAPAFKKVGGIPEPTVTTFQVYTRFPR